MFLVRRLAGLLVVLLAMPAAMPWRLAMVVIVPVWGIIHCCAIAPFQARIMEQASDAPTLASTLNQGAFNLGNALGAALGGAVLTAGYGYSRLPLASAVMVVLRGAVGVTTVLVQRRDRRLVLEAARS